MKKYFLPLGLIALLAVLLSPFLQNFVRELLVIPLLYLFWIGRFLALAVPQSVLWAILVATLALLMGVSLLGQRRPRPRADFSPAASQGRIESWATLISKAQDDDYFKWRLAQQLQKLTLNTLAHRQGQSLRQTRQQLRQGKLDIPPELQPYFLASLQPLGNLRPTRGLFRANTGPLPLDLDPRYIIYFLETLDNTPPREETP